MANDLVVVETLVPAVVFAPGGGGVDDIIARLKREVEQAPTDISTEAGRKAIASFAHKMARSKTALDAMGKELVAETKKAVNAIDKERSRLWDEVEALQKLARKPLTDWEDADKARIAGHEEALAAIQRATSFLAEPGSHEIQGRLDYLGEPDGRDWQEFKARAIEARALAMATLVPVLATALKREAEAVELARLRQEEAARAQRERDERIAREAADKARADAEAEHRRAEEIAARERTRLAQEAEASEARARKAEDNRIAAEAKAERDAANERQAEKDRAAAAEAKAKRDQEVAIEAERKRVADAKAAEEAAAKKREADKAHRAKINREALAALMLNAGVTEDQGKAVLTAIAGGKVPHVVISY